MDCLYAKCEFSILHHLSHVHIILFLIIYRYPLCHRLRDGWTGKIGPSVSCRAPVGKTSLADCNNWNKLLWHFFFSFVSEWHAIPDSSVCGVRTLVHTLMIVWCNEWQHINVTSSQPVIGNYGAESARYLVCRWCISWKSDMPSSACRIKVLRAEMLLVLGRLHFCILIFFSRLVGMLKFSHYT